MSSAGQKPWRTSVQADTAGHAYTVDVPSALGGPIDGGAPQGPGPDAAANGGRSPAFWVTLSGAGVLLATSALTGAFAVDANGYVARSCSEPRDFCRVPEPKTAKNRLHIDVTTDDLDALVAHGATVLRAKGDGGIGWTVLADPDGNEFCAFTDD